MAKSSAQARWVPPKGLAEHHDFPGLKALGRIESRRKAGGIVQTETREFSPSRIPAPQVFKAINRAHGDIENALHWQLHVKVREHAACYRKNNGLADIAILRRRALDLAPKDTATGSLSIKLRWAGWSDECLLSLLSSWQTHMPNAVRAAPAYAPLRKNFRFLS